MWETHTIFSQNIAVKWGSRCNFSPLRTPMWKTCVRASASWRSRRCARGSTISTTRRTWWSFRGRRFNGQRNHIHHFQRLYPDWSFERVTAQNLPEVCAFFDDFTRRYHKDSASAQAEEGCVREFLRDFAAYAPLAGLLRVNGRVVGFSAGEIVGDTLIIHIEKADIAYEGVYQALVNEYAKCFVTPGVRYINREEDAGDEGLRRSKESYHPVRLLEKYLVQIPAQPEKGDKSMQEVYEFLKKCGTYYLATVDGDQPHVRPFRHGEPV